MWYTHPPKYHETHPRRPSPDTSTIQWSHDMRIHIINTITASDCNPDHSNTHDDPQEVELLQPNKKQQCTRRNLSSAYVDNKDNTADSPPSTKTPHRPGTPPPLTHTHHAAPVTPQGGRNGGNNHRRQGKRKVSETTCTSTEHIIARDCITHGHTLHWEGDRNDQCEVCDKGGTLTECTRCNIVWHASCLQPTPVFPLRQQDAIVCGEECWTELTAAARSAGIPAPERETHNDDDGDFYSVTLAFRQTTGNIADGGQ